MNHMRSASAPTVSPRRARSTSASRSGHQRRRGGDAGRPAEGAFGEQSDRHPDRANIRQRYIIERMPRRFITSEQRDAALKQVLRYRAPSESRCTPSTSPGGRQMIFTQYGPAAYTRGFNVT